MPKRKTITVSDEDHNTLKKFAHLSGESISTVIKEMVESWWQGEGSVMWEALGGEKLPLKKEVAK